MSRRLVRSGCQSSIASTSHGRLRGDLPRIPPGGGAAGAEGDRDAQAGGLPAARSRGGRPAPLHPFTAGAGGGAPRLGEGGVGGDGVGVPEIPAGDGATGGRRPAEPGVGAPPLVQAPNIPAINFRITGEAKLGQGSDSTQIAYMMFILGGQTKSAAQVAGQIHLLWVRDAAIKDFQTRRFALGPGCTRTVYVHIKGASMRGSCAACSVDRTTSRHPVQRIGAGI
jgi:hypothetical protein